MEKKKYKIQYYLDGEWNDSEAFPYYFYSIDSAMDSWISSRHNTDVNAELKHRLAEIIEKEVIELKVQEGTLR